MRLSRLILVAVMAGSPLPRLASAQTASTSPAGDWSLSIGADPTKFDLRTRDPGVDARIVSTLTRSWQLRNPALRTHVSLMLGADAPRGFEASNFHPAVDVSRRYAGLTGGASYEMLRLSRFSTYVIAGGGLYRDELRSSVSCNSAACGNASSFSPRYGKTSFGINAGLGMNLTLGKRVLFIEQRIHAFDVRRIDQGVNPFSIGIRF